MAYGTLARTKEILGVTDTSQDTELTNLITKSDAEIDALLAREGLTVPGSVPVLITEASAYLAASGYRRERMSPTTLDAYRTEGMYLVKLYISDKLGGSVSGIPRESI